MLEDSSNPTLQKIETLSIAMAKAKSQNSIKEYNSLLSEYNSLIELLEEEDVSSTETDEIDEIASSKSIQSSHTGITNILNGIVNNANKGKYTEQDKRFFLKFLSEIIRKIEDIDFDFAKKEKAKRQKIYSSFSERL